MSISENIANLRERIASAAHRAGRHPQEIALMAITKTVAVESIREAHDAGIRLFGENRVQEFDAKSGHLELAGAESHMIGHLQSNKANRAAQLFDAIDSVDSLRLARKLNAAALELDKKLSVLVEINIGGEAAKTGIAAESNELDELLQAAPELSALEFRGLMAVPPYHDDPEDSRSYFRDMRRLFAKLSNQNFPGIEMKTLSMGMSHDFEIAIEEGSTCVRIGTAIFGERNK